MKTRKRLLKLLIIVFISFMLISCKKVTMEEIKRNSNAVNEYNKAIEMYNKLALSFTELARAISNELDGSQDFNEKFWKSYDSKKAKVLLNIDNITGMQFQFKQIGKILDSIESLKDDINDYLNNIEDFRDNKEESIEEMKIYCQHLYEEILLKSYKITEIFNSIYDEFIMDGNKK